jgi:hypothetical protein
LSVTFNLQYCTIRVSTHVSSVNTDNTCTHSIIAAPVNFTALTLQLTSCVVVANPFQTPADTHSPIPYGGHDDTHNTGLYALSVSTYNTALKAMQD